jgi:cytochrome P450 family 135
VDRALRNRPVAYRFLRRVSAGLPPGPRLPRPLQTALWTWRFPKFSHRSHERFGDTFTVRVGTLSPFVLTRDRDALRRLFTGDPLSKRHANDPLRPVFGEHSLTLLEPAEHLARRKMVLPAFARERIRGYGRLLDDLVAAELDRWRPGTVVTVHPRAQELTLEVIVQAVLGISDANLRRRLAEIFNGITTPPLANLAATIPQLTSRANPFGRPVWRLKDELDALLLAHVEATRADPRLVEREDVLAMLVSARDADGAGLTDEELRDELITLIAAGHETTTTAIAWGVELLAHHPAIAGRARADDDYLEAVVKEVLRVRTPVAIAGARRMLEPFPIERWTIPPGTTIYVNADGLHHDPAVHPQPEAFRPERFLEDPPNGYSFSPFGGGAHRCLGAGLALLEIKLVLGALLDRFELEPLSDQLARPVPRIVTHVPRGGCQVRVRPRARARRGSASAAPAAPAPR